MPTSPNPPLAFLLPNKTLALIQMVISRNQKYESKYRNRGRDFPAFYLNGVQQFNSIVLMHTNRIGRTLPLRHKDLEFPGHTQLEPKTSFSLRYGCSASIRRAKFTGAHHSSFCLFPGIFLTKILSQAISNKLISNLQVHEI